MRFRVYCIYKVFTPSHSYHILNNLYAKYILTIGGKHHVIINFVPIFSDFMKKTFSKNSERNVFLYDHIEKSRGGKRLFATVEKCFTTKF